MYFTITDLAALIPQQWLTEALDDANLGTPDSFTAVQTAAEREVNGTLSVRFKVPLDVSSNAGLAAFLGTVSSYIAAEICYGRRPGAGEFPYAAALKGMRDQLKAMAKGEQPLSPTEERVVISDVVIAEPSRSWSSQLSA